MPEQLVPLRIGGVPEHFNVPWWLAIESQALASLGIALEWHECAGGTGEMMRGLADGQLDLALALSEGAVTAIAAGTPAAIIQWYVQSPLHWGIHVAAASAFQTVDDLRGARFAISRPGSGSHLMSYVEAQRRGWFAGGDDQPPMCFVEVGHLRGGIDALSQGRADAFLWERFTTQPWVDQGIFRRVGICPTPWPAFALVARTGLAPQTCQRIRDLAAFMNHYAPAFKQRPDASAIISTRCNLPQQQVDAWLAETQWASSPAIDPTDLINITTTLDQLHLLQRPVKIAEVLF